MPTMRSVLGALSLLSLPLLCTAKAGIYRKPPMGWMSWEKYGCQRDCVADPEGCISAKLYQDKAQQLVDGGFAAKGYTWVNVDDCYLEKGRDPVTNKLRADPARFPGGIKALSDFMHSRGLHLGVYNDIGPGTCAGDPALDVSAVPNATKDARLKLDAETFAEWGIDSIKIDGCGGDKFTMNVTYPKLGAALNATGRQIFYTCSWPVYESLGIPGCNSSSGFECLPFGLLADSCNSWRIYKDIMDTFYLPGHAGIRNIIEILGLANQTLRDTQRPGAYHDPDMLMLGNNGLSLAEAKIQFGMWAMWSAPMMMSNDLLSLSADMKDVLLNEEVIAVDQDDLGLFATAVTLTTHVELAPSSVQLWKKPLADGSVAVAIVNFGVFDGQTYNASFSAEQVGLKAGSSFSVRDLFAKHDVGAAHGGSFWAQVHATSIEMFKLTPLKSQ